jgi:serine/threonine-protein kinase
MVTQNINGIPFQLKEPYDFSFLKKFGKVFKVFDKSSSGAICFGVEQNGKRYFLKFAGAKTINDSLQNIEDTIARLKVTVPKYHDLKHHLLINQIGAEEIGGGFLTVYNWFEGESCGYPQRESWLKFKYLPVEKKLPVYEGILEFHAHVAECGYVAIDFNDQATLYNFDDGSFAICDIDFYTKQCYMNGYGGIWGDPAIMSPEESRCGAIIDEISNVFTMGATAFVFFADDDKSTREKWKLNDKLYGVAHKAINELRNQRQQTIRDYIKEWKEAKASI